MMAAAQDRHDVFISYSRKNIEFVRDLERALRAYRPPKETDPTRRHLQVFRDESDFTGTDYVQAIRDHLTASRKLVVVCSPEAAASTYVDDEIAQFAEVNGRENIIPLLLSGIPNNEVGPGQESQAAFPQALTRALEMPLAVDYRGYAPGFRNRVRSGPFSDRWYSLLANLYDVSRREIERRESRRKARLRRYWVAGATAVIVSLSAVTVWALISRAAAVRERRIATSRELVARTRTLQGAQAEIAERKTLLAAEALLRLRSVNTSALDAEIVLADAMSQLPLRVLEIPGGPDSPVIAFSADGLTLLHAVGDQLSSWNLHTGMLQRRASLRAPAVELVVGPRRDMIAVRDQAGGLELRSVSDLSIRTSETGSVYPGEVACLAFNAEGTLMALLGQAEERARYEVRLMRTVDWQEHARFDLPAGLEPANARGGRTPCLAFRPASDAPETLMVALRGGATAEPERALTVIAHQVRSPEPDPFAQLLPVERRSQPNEPAAKRWNSVHLARFSGDGKRLLIVDDNLHELGLAGWTEVLQEGTSSSRSTGRRGLPSPEAISPDGRLFVSSRSLAEDPYVPLLSTTQLEIRRTADGAQLAEIPGTRFQFTGDSSALLTTKDRLVRLWSVSSGQEIYRFESRQSPASIRESPGGRYLALTADDGSVDVWDIGHPQELVRTAATRFAALSPDGAHLAVGGTGWLQVIDLDSALVMVQVPFEGVPAQATWSRSGRHLAVTARRARWADESPRALVLDLRGDARVVWRGSDVYEIALAPDDQTLYVAGARGSLSVFSIATGASLWELSVPGESVRRPVISSDGRILLAVLGSVQWGVTRGPVLVLDARSGAELTRLDGGRVTTMAISDSGHLVALADIEHSLRVVDLASSRTLSELPHPETLDEVFGLAFLPGDKRLASLAGSAASTFLGGRFYTEQAAFVWDLTSNTAMARIPLATDGAADYQATLEEEDKAYPVDLVLSADGSVLGGTVYPSRWAYRGVSEPYVSAAAVVWDLRAPTPTEILRLPDRQLDSLAAAGRVVLARGAGDLAAWSTDRSAVDATLCQRVSRQLTDSEQKTYLAGESYTSRCPPPPDQGPGAADRHPGDLPTPTG